MADKPIVRAERSGRPSAPGVPVFSYCKREDGDAAKGDFSAFCRSRAES